MSRRLIAIRKRDVGGVGTMPRRTVYDLVIQLGCGRKHAEEVRARIELAMREVLASQPSENPSVSLGGK